MYIWRIPGFILAAEITTIVLLVCVRAILAWVGRGRGRAAKGVAAIVAATLASPLLVQAIVDVPRRLWPEVPSAYFVVPWQASVAPAIATAIFLSAEAVLFGRSWRWTYERLLFHGVLGVSAALNFVNWCSPGWCETFGFPLPWHAVSDAVATINGWTPPTFFPFMLWLDAAVLCTILLLAGRFLRKKEVARLARVVLLS